MIFHPLSQFEVHNLNCPGLVIVTNVFWTGLIILGLMSWSIVLLERKDNVYKMFIEKSVKLIRVLLKENLRIPVQYYGLHYYYLFMFVLVVNLLGLFPYSYTLTSSFVVTLFLAMTQFIGLNLIGIYIYKWKILKLLIPNGVPLLMTPLLVIIELISYIAKVFSLSIRLFANMMSGHALLKILTSFAYTMGQKKLLIIFAWIPWVLVTIVYGIEVLIAVLQAYVFTMLSVIYHSDVIYHH